MRFAAAAGALLAMALVAGCGESPEPVPERPTPTQTIGGSAAPGSRSVTDMVGRVVSLPETVGTVAAMSPAAAEFAAALGLEIVGRSNDTPEAVAPAAKTTGPAISPDFNAIAELQPDLVLADAAYHSGRTRDFDRFAYPVFVLKATNYAEVLAALSALGEATGREAEAEAARAGIESRAKAVVDAAKGRLASGAVPRVLLLSGGGRDVFAGGSLTYAGSLIELLGAANVYGGTPAGGPIAGFGVVEIGQSATLNPDVVLILPSGDGGLSNQLKAHSAWVNSSVVRGGRVHDLDTGLFLRTPGPRVAEALEALFALLWR